MITIRITPRTAWGKNVKILGHKDYIKHILYIFSCRVENMGPDDDLDEVETCRPCKKTQQLKIHKMCLTEIILVPYFKHIGMATVKFK